MQIRKISESDLEQRVKWMNNPKVYKTMHFVPPISLENTKRWYEGNRNNANRFDAAFIDDEGAPLAFGGLTNIDYSVRKAEFYIFVNPEMQGKGIGTKATYLLLKYGFEVLQLHKVYLFTNASNTGAKKTYEKVGFKLEGIHREENIIDEKYEDRLYYGFLAKDFDSGKEELKLAGWSDVQLDECKVDDLNIKLVRDDTYPQICGGGV